MNIRRRRMHPRPLRWLIAAIAAAALVFVGCGGDDESPPVEEITEEEAPDDQEAADEEEAPAAEGEQVTLTLVAENTSFNQSTLTVPVGAQVTIEFENRDALGHNFALYEESGGEPIFQGDIVTGTTTYEFTAPDEPGSYYFQCDPHSAQMNGTFVVE